MKRDMIELLEQVEETVRVTRRRTRVETLRELATLARAGIHLDAEALEEMAAECERATTVWRSGDIEGYDPSDPKSPGYHDRMVDFRPTSESVGMLGIGIAAMMPREARHRYFQKGRGPMFVWTVEPFKLWDETARENGKYESVVYKPVGKGSRSGKATRWERDEETASLHALRKDAKARALKLYREWEEAQR